jgi:putative endonuclease
VGAARDDRSQIGKRAEDLACACLEARGIRIVERNWRHREGEIDVVADDGGTCVFVEVRSRTGVALGHALEAVTARKRAQVIRAARLYLAEETPAASGYRFDVVGVTFFDDGRGPEVDYVESAFEVG